MPDGVTFIPVSELPSNPLIFCV